MHVVIRKTVAEYCASLKTIERNSIIVDGSLDYLICDNQLIGLCLLCWCSHCDCGEPALITYTSTQLLYFTIMFSSIALTIPLCALSTVSGLYCTESSVLQHQCTTITLGLVFPMFILSQTGGVTISKQAG